LAPTLANSCPSAIVAAPGVVDAGDAKFVILKLVGPIQREHATPAQPTLFRGGKIFTIQPFSRKCPIGHALDIPFENWTSSCRFSNSVSSSGLLNCTDAACLTSCHLGFVSDSCHFSPPPGMGLCTCAGRGQSVGRSDTSGVTSARMTPMTRGVLPDRIPGSILFTSTVYSGATG
jgi:hypothetical protein